MKLVIKILMLVGALAFMIYGFRIPIKADSKVNPIIGVQEDSHIENTPKEDYTPIFTITVNKANIVSMDAHPLGSKGYLWYDEVVVCTGQKGDNCLLEIVTDDDQRFMYFLPCGIQDKPIATFNTETQQWTITYSKRVTLS